MFKASFALSADDAIAGPKTLDSFWCSASGTYLKTNEISDLRLKTTSMTLMAARRALDMLLRTARGIFSS